MSNPVIGLFIILLIPALAIERLFSLFSKEVHKTEHLKVVDKATMNEFKTNKGKKNLKSIYHLSANDCQRGSDAQRNPAIEMIKNTEVQNRSHITLIDDIMRRNERFRSKFYVCQQFNNETNPKTQYSIGGNYKMINQSICINKKTPWPPPWSSKSINPKSELIWKQN